MSTKKLDINEEPIVSLPPFEVDEVFISLAETRDWGLRMLNIPSLWRQTEGEGISVAVLDSGISLNHPDLAGAVKRYGYKDFTGSPHGIGDENGHGTHCAGIIAARKNSRGVVGVAPKANLLVGKVLDDNGVGKGIWIAKGIDWAIKKEADVISMSLGNQTPIPVVHEAIKRAVEKGVFVICAAGNDSLDYVDFPAAHPETIAVGSINRKKRFSSFTSIGKEVTIVAPGEDILSTFPPRTYATLSGTSMATPFVAGVVALMLAKHLKYGGETLIETQKELITHLMHTAIDLGKTGFDEKYGYGLIKPTSLLKTPQEKGKP